MPEPAIVRRRKRARSASHPATVALGALLALGLAGCGRDTPPKPASTPAATARPAAPLPPAEVALNTRIIELKNKLQADPYAAEARLEFGLALMQRADMPAAEAELVRALELGLDPNRVLPPLARVWNLTGKSKLLIQNHAATKLSDPAAAAELKSSLATAYANTGDPASARRLVAEALRDDPNAARPRVLLAEIALSEGRIDDALRGLDEVLAEHPRSTDAWRLKADVLQARRDTAGATAAYEKVLEIDPHHLPTHAKLIALAFAAADLDTAQSRLDRLRLYAPEQLQTMYFGARLAEARGDLVTARDMIGRALEGAPDDIRSLLLAATIEMKSGALRSAEDLLDRALIKSPGVPRTRHLLAQVYMRAGAPEKAQGVLEPLLRGKAVDATALGLAAEASLQAGLTLRATQLFERAAAADPGNPRYRAALAVARIARGEVEAGFSELEATAARDRTTYADMALLSARLRSGNLPAAIKAAEGVARKHPQRALPQWLLGRLKLQSTDPAQARGHFERALEIDRAFAPAAMALAALDLEAGNRDQARARIDAVLAQSPKNLDALIGRAQLRQRAGEPVASVTAALEDAVRLHPGHPRPRLALIDHLIRAGDGPAALAAAQKATNALPRDLSMVDALGRAQLAAGETAQALGTYRRLVTARPGDAEPHLKLADIYVARGETTSALESLRTAITLKPDLLPAQIRLAGLATQARDWREALRVARTVQQQRPADPKGWHLEGLVHAAQQDWAQATASYRSALQKGESSELAVDLHAGLLAAGKLDEAERHAAQWLARHPKDMRFIGMLADTALVRNDLPTAERHYRAILATDRDNVGALNNLAWVLAQQSKAESVALARRAVELAPGRADLLDTLSLALAADGQLAAALANQKRAVALDPKLPVLRLHLARLAVKAGEFVTARTELDGLSAMGKDFPAQAEVWQLRQQLR